MSDTESLTIPRKSEPPADTSFESLRAEGLSTAQKLSGNIWTDYNLHDPGVTILEQLCYAITDLVYRTEFDVPDYLCNEKGVLDLESLGLQLPEEVLFSRPTTANDYRKALLDESVEIASVWVKPGNEFDVSCASGLYKILVKRKSQSLQHHSAGNESVRRSVLASYLSRRNLCEDIESIDLTEENVCRLEGTISIEPGNEPEEVLAHVYYEAAKSISNAVEHHPFSSILEKDTSWEETLRGPFTPRGHIDNDDLAAARESFSAEFLSAKILPSLKSVEGVKKIVELAIVPGDDNKRATKDFVLADPRDGEAIEGLTCILDRGTLDIDLEHFVSHLERLYRLEARNRPALSKDSVLAVVPNGVDRDLSHYQSIQNGFPATYGINQFGVPDSFGKARKAQALQLKSYLILFEQQISNYLANLGAINKLFSIRVDDDPISFHQSLENQTQKAKPASIEQCTYFFGALRAEEIADLDKVYPGKNQEKVRKAVGQYDQAFDRVSRLLDYMLAIYGEYFPQNQLRNFNFYYTEDQLKELTIVLKSHMLKLISVAGESRAAGFNYSLPSWEVERAIAPGDRGSHAGLLQTVSGLQFRSSLLLGLKYHHSRSLTDPIRKLGLRIRHDNTAVPSTGASATSERQKLLAEAYNRGRKEVSKAGSIARRKLIDRQGLLNKTVEWNTECEGMHVVEHILLRQSDATENLEEDCSNKQDPEGSERRQRFNNRFTNRISVILPNWTARFSNAKFQRYAEYVIRENCPAHIDIEFLWLDYQRMVRFESRYRAWLRQLKKSCEKRHSDDNQEVNSFDRVSSLLSLFLENEQLFFQSRKQVKSLLAQLKRELKEHLGKIRIRNNELRHSLGTSRPGSQPEMERRLPVDPKLLHSVIEGIDGLKCAPIDHIGLLPSEFGTGLADMENIDLDRYFFKVSVVFVETPELEGTDEKDGIRREVFQVCRRVVEQAARPGITCETIFLGHSLEKEFTELYVDWRKQWRRQRHSLKVDVPYDEAIARLNCFMDTHGKGGS